MDVYKVGVTMSLRNGVSAGLRLIRHDLGGVMKALDKANASTKDFGRAMVAAGAAGVAAGAAVLDVWEKVIAKGDLMQRQIAKMQASGVRTGQIPLNTKAAWSASTGMFNVSPQHAAETLTQLRGFLGSSAEARAALKPVLRAEVGLNSALGGKAASGLIQALKALDITGSTIKGGKMSVPALLKNLPYIEQAMILTHGMLTGSDIKRMIQQAGPAATATSFRRLLVDTTEATLALGPAVGRGLFMGYKLLFAGQANALQATTLTKLGLLPGAAVHKIKGSFYRIINTDKLYADAYLKKHGELAWLHNRVIPLLEKEGYKTPQAIIQQLTRILPSSTGARLGAWVTNNWPQRDRFRHLLDQAVAHAHPYQAAMTTWAGAASNFSKAWSGLITALGVPAVKNAAAALNSVSRGIHHLTAWLAKHPGMAKRIDQFLFAFGAGLATFGAVIASAGVAALVGTGGLLTGLAAGIGAIGLVLAEWNWKALGHAVDSGIRAVGNAINWLLHPLQKAMTYLFGPTHPGAASHNVGIAALRNPYAHPGATGTQAGLGVHPLFHYFGGNGGHWVHHGSLAGGFDTWAPPPPSSHHAGSSAPTVNIGNWGEGQRAIKNGLGASLNRNQSGTTGFNGRVSPAGSPAYADGL